MTQIEQDQAALRLFQERVRVRLPGVEPHFVLFGSKARGDDRVDSDVDVLVIVPRDDLSTRDAVYAASVDVSLACDAVVSPKVRSREAFARMRTSPAPFAREVTRDGVPL